MHNTARTYLTLVWQLFRRDVRLRYTGTLLGGLWLIAQPLFMLLVYTLVFGEILAVRFPAVTSQTGDHPVALTLFAGLMLFNALAEVLTRAPSVLLEQRDLLMNTPLPASILPLLPVATSLLVELLSVALLCGWLMAIGQWHAQGLMYYPLVLITRLLLALAGSYTLAILGVFLRDLRQLMPPLMTVLLLVSPIVYPLTQVPERWQSWFWWNPLTHLVQAYRDALLGGQVAVMNCMALMVIAGMLCALAILLFQRLMPRARYVL